MRNEVKIDMEDLAAVLEIIRKYFPDNKVVLKAYNSPEDGELEVIVSIEVPTGYGVQKTIDMLDKFDEEMWENQDLQERLINVCIMTNYV
jgi:hypothetical protein